MIIGLKKVEMLYVVIVIHSHSHTEYNSMLSKQHGLSIRQLFV